MKKKDETQICKWEESTDNFLIKVYQRFDEKGKIRKYVQKYTLKDTSLIETKLYDENDVLLSASNYEPRNRRMTEYTLYKKGEETYKYTYQYDEQNLIYSSKEYKGEFRSKSVFEYNEHLLNSIKEFDKDNQVKKYVKLSY